MKNDYTYVVCAIIRNNDRFLLGKKIKKDTHSLSERWHIPGGKVNNGESETDALTREVKEETGLNIEIEKYLAEDTQDKIKCKFRFYLCKPVSGDMKAGDDLSELKFCSSEEVYKLIPADWISRWPKEVREFFSGTQMKKDI